ncbi:MAG TPA: cell envelope integrity protein TolA [Gammaproteobacteria bacterium]|jgi:colicin import membrane protein|nr:cell envelope integrity protein TolA [Gammaproteobacteria bacterium]
MWKAIRENPRAVTYAVLMHLVLLALLAVGLDWTPKAIKPGVKTPIEAELVSSDQLRAIEQRKQEDRRRQEAEEQRKLDAAAAQNKAAAEKVAAGKAAAEKQKAAAEQKKQAELAAQKKAAAEKQRQADIAAKKKAEAAEAAKKKAAAEAQRKAEAAKQQAAAEAQRKAEAAARKQAEADLQAQLAAEAERARAESALAEFIPYIQERIQRNWLRPAGSPAGLSCLVKVRLIPGGDVVSVNVVRSSGDAVFDRSVETAVLKASPLPLPADANLFKHFREINFNFDPGR